MKPTKLRIEDFKGNELPREKSIKIIGGDNFEENKEILDKVNLFLLSTIDPPKIDKPTGQP